MSFHLANGVGVGQRCQGGGIGRKRRAVSCLAEGEKVVGEGPCLVDRQAVTQRRPLADFLPAEFQTQFPPLEALPEQRRGQARKVFNRIVLVLWILGWRLLEKLP